MDTAGEMQTLLLIAHRTAMALGLLLGTALMQSSSAAIRIGDIQSFGNPRTEHYRMGLELAVDEINEEGGVRGEQIILLTRDDQKMPNIAVDAAKELIHGEGVCCILGGGTGLGTVALAHVAESEGVLLLAPLLIGNDFFNESSNRYTFKLRPSAYVQAAMLASEAAGRHKKHWATIASNSAYGREVVAAFKAVLGRMRRDVTFVKELWLDPLQRESRQYEEFARALATSRAEGILTALNVWEVERFVSAIGDSSFFNERLVVGPLLGNPESLDRMSGHTPEGWLVTGYPWYEIEFFQSPSHYSFVQRYQRRYGTHPRMASLLGHTAGHVIAAAIAKAGGTEVERIVEAMESLEFEGPSGPFIFRREDHQSTMGAYVGWTQVERGRGRMVRWKYLDGRDYLRSQIFD